MIIIQLIGGLGNQMFQYAFGRYLSLKFNKKLYLDHTLLETKPFAPYYTDRDYELEIFNLNVSKADITLRNHFFNKQPNLFYKLKSLFTTNRFEIIREENTDLDTLFLKEDFDYYLIGYWQQKNYLKNIEKEIKTTFSFHTNLGSQNIEIKNRIESTNSVSIHVRRGDYVTNESVNKINGSCTVNYYESTINEIVKTINNPVFFLFTDDPQWVKENIKISNENHLIDWNKDKDSYIDLYLMSLCKHNIIANSSFSWWAAWLNENSQKTVIAPENWYTDAQMNYKTKDLITDTWKRM